MWYLGARFSNQTIAIHNCQCRTQITGLRRRGKAVQLRGRIHTPQDEQSFKHTDQLTQQTANSQQSAQCH